MAKNSAESRSLVFSDSKSNKFWDIEVDGSSHTVRFGRIGTAGQSQTKEFSSESEAKKSFDKLVAEKLKKGYTDAAGVASGTVVASKNAISEKPKSPTSARQQTDVTVVEAPQVSAPDTAPPVPPPADASVNLAVTRVIDLEPQEWLLARYRQRVPLERKSAPSFDKDECIGRLVKLAVPSYGWIQWTKLRLPEELSKEEAHFWFVAIANERKSRKPKQLVDLMTNDFTGAVDLETVIHTIDWRTPGWPDLMARALSVLLSPLDMVELIMSVGNPTSTPREALPSMATLLRAFQIHVAPYLTDDQLKPIHERLRKNWDPLKEPTAVDEGLAPEYYLAASVNMHDEVYQVTSHWSDDRFSSSPERRLCQIPQVLVLGLGSADRIEAEWRRLGLNVRSHEEALELLACTEYSMLDCLVKKILEQTNKELCLEYLEILARVRAPEAALPMLECKLSAKSPAIAREWLEKNIGNAITGLIEAVDCRGKLADAAIDYLRDAKRKGYDQVIAAAVQNAKSETAAAKVTAEVLDYQERVYEPFGESSTPAWLSQELAALKLKPKRLPTWATAATLPPLVVGERRLSDQQVDVVLQLLAAMPITARHALLSALRQHTNVQARDDFAWKLFQRWSEDGFPSKDKWAMGAIGQLGDAGCVYKLTPLIRVWPGESQHARAVFGLECLRAIGSNVALMQLSGMAQKLKFKGLKAKAQQFVDEIAKENGMTRDELEDRVVPDCGLDEDGRREFSFGARRFSFVLGGDLKAMIRDENGKVRANLPAPGAKDDEQIAAESIAEWKLLKKQIKDVATIQVGRLEQAMVTGRRWNVADFETLLVRHPLMPHLIQKLICGGYDAQGKRLLTFRVTEERDYANSDDDAISLADVALVGILHPLDMSETDRAQWGEVISDYEIVAPFPQLGRAVYSLEPDEGTSEELGRFHGLSLYAPTLVFTLEKLGWTRGVALDAGSFDEHSKQFPAAQVTAVIGYDGYVGMGYIDPDTLLTLSSVHFVQGMRERSGYGWGSENKLELAAVPPIVISEVIADLQVVKSKAK
ncbi:MAG: DUF4132 domain-containing protein [Planctomycetales bacterium]|nr:DUF4132 domain-containing protein [Planctomycetales bacterium]